jgi:putative SOS response-associated peptidase YedK
MCGRFTLEPTTECYARFDLANRLPDLQPRYNIAPGQLVPVMINHEGRRLTLMRWGLIPHWAKDAKTAHKMINARLETLTQRPAYRQLLAANRCLVPASGFFEWKAQGRGKTPYYIHPAEDAFVGLAGLFDTWTDPAGEAIPTFTIITREATDVVARLHHRMPVVLAPHDEHAWLDPELTAPSQVLAILSRSTGVPLNAYPVSRMVNTATVEGKELIRPLA